MNDPKLKLVMARLLPDKISITPLIGQEPIIAWKHPPMLPGGVVRETEWLYVMHLVEQTLDRKERLAFSVYLRETVVNSGGHASSYKEDIDFCCVSATLNQRATAMCKVKGIEE